MKKTPTWPNHYGANRFSEIPPGLPMVTEKIAVFPAVAMYPLLALFYAHYHERACAVEHYFRPACPLYSLAPPEWYGTKIHKKAPTTLGGGTTIYNPMNFLFQFQ